MLASSIDGDRIRRVDATIVDLAGCRPHRHPAVGAGHQSYVVVEVETEGGVSGCGEVAIPGGPWWSGDSVETVSAMIVAHLGPAVVGRRVGDVVGALAEMDRRAFGNAFAKAGVEIALLDCLGRSSGLPVHILLGGATRTAVPLCWPLGIGDPGAEIEEAAEMIARDQARLFKVKMGALAPEDDVSRALAIAAALGGRAGLRIDLNGAWPEAVSRRHIPALVEAGYELIEQPMERRFLQAHQRLAELTTATLMADESFATVTDAIEIARTGAFQALALKPMKAGGLMAARTSAETALALGLTLFGGCFMESSVGTAANLHLAAALPELHWGCEWMGPLWLVEDITEPQIRYENGAVVLPDGPGLGVDLDRDKLHHFARAA